MMEATMASLDTGDPSCEQYVLLLMFGKTSKISNLCVTSEEQYWRMNQLQHLKWE